MNTKGKMVIEADFYIGYSDRGPKDIEPVSLSYTNGLVPIRDKKGKIYYCSDFIFKN